MNQILEINFMASHPVMFTFAVQRKKGNSFNAKNVKNIKSDHQRLSNSCSNTLKKNVKWGKQISISFCVKECSKANLKCREIIKHAVSKCAASVDYL